MMNIILAVIILMMACFICWREWYHDKERKDLYNRIMAGNAQEYVRFGDDKPPPKGRNFVKKNIEKANMYEEVQK